MQGRVDEAAAAMEGALIGGEPDRVWRGAALDSRRVRGGELFFALPGERSDGHRFVADAFERGAAAAVVHADVDAPTGAALIRVEDCLAALHALTRAARARAPSHLVAITGSAGKTTTKELLARMLGEKFRVARSPGNLNNLYGFPLALLAIPEDCEWMVAEMGMSVPGELGQVSRLGRPDVAVFTNVRAVHLEFFPDLRAIGDAKAELLEGLAPGGLVVANAGDPEVVRIAARHEGPVVFYGLEPAAEVRAERIEAAADEAVGSRFVLVAGGEERPVALPLHGTYNIENFLAAAACAHALGVPIDSIVAAAASARPAAGRGEIHRLPGGALLVDDSYNSNPDAARRALESAARLPGERHWAVLGDMLELGPDAPRFHRETGEAAAALGFSPVIGVGPLARETVAAASSAGAEGRWFEDGAAAAAALAGTPMAGDVVLIKGSRGVGLEVVVESLLAREAGA